MLDVIAPIAPVEQAVGGLPDALEVVVSDLPDAVVTTAAGYETGIPSLPGVLRQDTDPQ